MQWWTDFTNWLGSDDGWRIISTAVIPFVAIIVAGLLGALIGRGSTRRLIDHQDRELQASAISAMIDAGRSASTWSGLNSGQQEHADSQFIASDIRLRLLPITGASAAADWATHELHDMRKNSASFSFQAEQTFVEYRDRLLEWQRKPGRARKLFALDLERFRYEGSTVDAELVEQQQRWAADEAAAAQEVSATPSATAIALQSAPPPVVETEPTAFAAPEPLPEPVPAPSHVNAEHEEEGEAENEIQNEAHEYAEQHEDDEAEVLEPVLLSEEDRNEDDEPIASSQEPTQALPLSYFEPVATRPPFPGARDDS